MVEIKVPNQSKGDTWTRILMRDMPALKSQFTELILSNRISCFYVSLQTTLFLLSK